MLELMPIVKHNVHVGEARCERGAAIVLFSTVLSQLGGGTREARSDTDAG